MIVSPPTDLLRAGVFGSYVAWLTLFPMGGTVLGSAEQILWFLTPHAIALLVCGWRLQEHALRPLLIAGTACCLAVSAVFLHLPDEHTTWALLLLGLAAAPLSMQQAVILRCSTRPALSAALGLVAGNLLAMAAVQLPLGATIYLPLLSMLLALALWTPCPKPARQGRLHHTVVIRYLPSILCFQIVSGLMYGTLYPEYLSLADTIDIEFVFYVLGALAGVVFFSRSPDSVLLCGTLTALLAFAAWQLMPNASGLSIALFAMLIAAGLIDVFLLALVLSVAHTLRAYGFGVGTLCAGIVLGLWLTDIVGERIESVVFAALVALNAAAIVMFLPWHITTARREPAQLPSYPPRHDGRSSAVGECAQLRLPDHLATILSEQEQHVLQLALGKHTYREIGERLAISESSVKTYMQRIFRKTGLVHRRQLQTMLKQWQNHE